MSVQVVAPSETRSADCIPFSNFTRVDGRAFPPKLSGVLTTTCWQRSPALAPSSPSLTLVYTVKCKGDHSSAAASAFPLDCGLLEIA